MICFLGEYVINLLNTTEMKNFRLLSGFGFAMILTFAVSAISLQAQTYQRDYADGKIYLKFKNDVRLDIPVNSDRTVNLDDASFLNNIREKHEISGLKRPFDLNNDEKLLRTFELSFTDFSKISDIRKELLTNADIEYVESVPLDYIYHTPNDSLYNREYGFSNWNWHLDVIDAELAWDVEKGDPDIKIAIVDNAVWVDHPDLADKIVLSEDITLVGTQNSNPPQGGNAEDWSHGTHCAGLSAAHSDNLIGVASLGYNVSLIGVKASTSNPITITYGYAGIQWAANNGADIISMSWGSTGFSQTNQNLINSIYAMGIVLVAAAGNDNSNTTQYPAGYNHVIGVAATDEDDVKSDFSNYGNWVDVSAPGGSGIQGPGGLLSTTWDYTSLGYYDAYPGTSMACPLTAGLCGLILSINPELSPDEVENILEASCEDIDTIAGNVSYAGQLGAGRINAYQAVINTPFAPLANFYTDVRIITPGTSIQYYDMSEGIPESWSWEFMGGSPHLSSQVNPVVTYSNEGIYTVYLTVTNDFGQNSGTKTDYITVSSTPVPWVTFSSSAEYVCSGDTVVFTDESLYEPVSWNWEFQPSSIVYLNGTNSGSQNPRVRFEAPGFYSVSLTATNENGSNSKTVDEMIFVEGIAVDYNEGFESGESSDFILSHNARGRVRVDTRAASGGSDYGMHFTGYALTGGWSGGANNTTPDQAWLINTDFHAFADICSVDATGIDGVTLNLDLRQTYSAGNTYSWFRVLVNDEPLADIYGTENFNPETNQDPFETKTFDLSQYGNSNFSLRLQSACYLGDKFINEGDNAFVDNIILTNTTAVTEGIGKMAGVLTYPNPASDVLNYSVHGAGKDITVEVLNLQGSSLHKERIQNYADGDVRRIATGRFTEGIYMLRISGDQGISVKKIVVK
jgi:PKD repeat protein